MYIPYILKTLINTRVTISWKNTLHYGLVIVIYHNNTSISRRVRDVLTKQNEQSPQEEMFVY